MTKNRNSSLELLRIISMLMIVASHSYYHNNWSLDGKAILSNIFLQNLFLGNVGVSCFILISAYFLSKSKIKIRSIIKIVLQVFFYSVFMYMLAIILGVHTFNAKDLITVLFPIITKQYWFITFYLIMYITSPFINILINNLKRERLLCLIYILVGIYILLPSFASLTIDWSPSIWFFILYLVGGYIGKHVKVTDNRKKYLSMIIGTYSIIFLSIIVFNLYALYYNSPWILHRATYFLNQNSILVFILSINLFLFSLSINIEVKLINKISVLIFGVYLIHDNQFIRPFIWDNVFVGQHYYGSVFLPLYMFCVIILLFAACIIIDYLRFNFIEIPIFKIISKYKLIDKIGVVWKRLERKL